MGRTRSSRARLPRPRGDGPPCGSGGSRSPRAPPPTRGWTPAMSISPSPDPGSPAHAGMDPARRRRRRPARRLPRPRGDGPAGDSAYTRPLRAPPPTRGWTAVSRVQRRVDRGSPAHAGMDPRRRAAPGTPARLPRPRGDGPRSPRLTANPALAPPPTRGWTLGAVPHARRLRGSPAHAGMDPRLCAATVPVRGLPRPRGDGPLAASCPVSVIEAPPPTRGWTVLQGPDEILRDGSPAHAGMDSSWR